MTRARTALTLQRAAAVGVGAIAISVLPCGRASAGDSPAKAAPIAAAPATPSTPAPAAQPAPVVATTPPPAPSADLLATLRGIKAAAYPDANAVRALDEESIVYQKDGTHTDTVHEVEVALTEQGRDAIATQSADYVTDRDHIEGLWARVIKADGTVIPVPASAIKDTVRGGMAFMNIYSENDRTAQIAFPGVAVGDAVEWSYRDVVTHDIREGFTEDFHPLVGMSGDVTPAGPSFEPILRGRYEVDGPAAMPIAYKVYHQDRAGTLTFAQTASGDRVHYTWTQENGPQLIPEPLMDAMTEIPSIVWSTDPDWKSMSRWCSRIDEPKIRVDDAIKHKVAELTKNAKTDEEKIKALYDFVSSDIRYRGGATTTAGAEPYASDETLKKRWGVCRDVAVLLTAMLRASGFHAYTAITNEEGPIPGDIARAGLDHEIAVIEWPDKKGDDRFQFIDPTAKNSVDLLPAMEHQQQAYVCTPEGEDLMLTPAAPPSSSLGRIQLASTLDASGALDTHLTLTTSGVFDLALRSLGAMVSPAQQHHFIEELLHASLPQAQLVSFALSSALALTKPMQADAEIKVPNAAIRAGNYLLVRTLLTSGAVDVASALLPQLLGAKAQRKFALDTRITFQLDQDETLTLPAGAHVAALPNDVASENAVSSLASKCTQAADTVTCHRSFQIKSRFIDPAQYSELRSVLASTRQVAHQPVILTAPAAATAAGTHPRNHTTMAERSK